MSGNRDGLGLGLAIVRRTANLLETPVSLQSRIGRGSMFGNSMPVLRWDGQSVAVRTPAVISAIAHARVLVVDNDPAALAATAALLGKWGLEVIRAGNIADAQQQCPTAPDAAIMDCRLDDDERGDAAYSALCGLWQAAPPAILLTAEASEETEQATQRMAARRLLKPPSPAALRALIADAIARGRQGDDQDRDDVAAG